MPDHRAITTFTLVKFILSFAAFTKVSVSVYTRKMFTLVSKLSYLSKHGISLRSKRFRLVSETEERTGFSVLAAREMKQEPKNESGGRGRGRKETLADKPLDFENLRSPANAAPDWLG